LLKYVAEIGKPMMVSTGGATMEDVERAHDAIVPINSQLCIMQCTSSYPAAADELNLKVIETYRERFGDIVVGLSDHQNGIAMAMLAFMLGARMIEKHFTINRAWKGTDQAFSLEPAGMGRLVRDLQRARVALGDGVKQMFPDEKEPLHKMRKKLVAAKDVPTGQILSREDLTIKAPGDGLAPYYLDEVIGMTATRPLAVDDDIKLEYLRK
jgi:N-acetylneuraminate synthase/sialic acid synthase